MPRFRPLRFLGWLACGAVLSVALAWLSVQLQKTGFAPLGLFSIGFGAALGLGLGGLLRLVGFGHRRAALTGALVLALLAAGGQHVFAYLDYRAHYEQALQSNAKLAFLGGRAMSPRPFLDYMRADRGQFVVVLWTLDAVMIVFAACGLVAAALTASPFCDECQSWYRTTRGGALPDEEAERVAALCDLALPAGARGVQYELRACRGGCGPARLTLAWTDAKGRREKRHCRLARESRRAIEDQLDQDG